MTQNVLAKNCWELVGYNAFLKQVFADARKFVAAVRALESGIGGFIAAFLDCLLWGRRAVARTERTRRNARACHADERLGPVRNHGPTSDRGLGLGPRKRRRLPHDRPALVPQDRRIGQRAARGGRP